MGEQTPRKTEASCSSLRASRIGTNTSESKDITIQEALPAPAGREAGGKKESESLLPPEFAVTESEEMQGVKKATDAGMGSDEDCAVADIPASQEAALAKPSSDREEEETPPEPPAPLPKPVWKVLEPEDQSDPVPHEICELKVRNIEWNIVSASVRGKLHAHKGLWRDDSFAVDWVDNWTIIAVADGAGSAKLSRVGSSVACNSAVSSLKLLLEDFVLSRRSGDAPSESDFHRLRAFMVHAAGEGRNAVVREAHKRQSLLKYLNTTLLLAVHAPWGEKDLVFSIQVGDGVIGVYAGDGSCTVLGIADHGEFSAETVFLTSGTELAKKPLDQRIIFTIKQNVRCIAVMSDGISDDFFPEEKQLIELFNGNPIKELRTRQGDAVLGVMHNVVKNPRDGETLKEWLGYEKKGSSDDRTLVLMYRS
ncbi:MAG: hypothetical protein DDT32_00602 [Syntrophomonadaceae bacterium]|nr:hypothetical protein [Bacillota bacterium]MBT9146855.1 hypothetical protein [Bacillota bacterium]